MEPLKGNDAQNLELLRREYRNMEVNRKSFADESNLVLRKQEQTLEMLRKENENFKMDISALQARTTLKPLRSFEQRQQESLNSEIERGNLFIENEKRRIGNMERQISSLGERIWHCRRSMGGSNAGAENQRIVEKQVRILENKLEQALVKFNKNLANNRKLREEIDDLRGERISFEGIHQKLEKELQEEKELMAQVIEQSNLAYEQRDRAHMEIEAIAQTNRKEQEQFEQLMKELQNLLEKDMKAAADMKQLPSMTTSISEETKAETERKIAKANALSRERQLCAQQRRDKIQNFEEAFRKIAVATRVSDVEELIRIYIANEEKNYSLFSYANEQASEIDKLEEHTQLLEKEILAFEKEDGNETNQYEMILKDIEKKAKVSESQKNKYEEKCSRTQNILENLQDGIKILLVRLECTENENGEVSVTETNMLYYLGVIEQRTNDILGNYHKVVCKKNMYNSGDVNGGIINSENGKISISEQHQTTLSQSQVTILGSGPELPMGGEPLFVNPPRLTDYSSDENSVDEQCDGVNSSRPLTRDEIKLKINLNRRGKNATKGLSSRRGTIFRGSTSIGALCQRGSLSIRTHKRIDIK